MRRLLLVVCVIAVLGLASGASAQIPYVQVFFDEGASIAQKDCPGNALDQLQVFAINYNTYIAAIKYRVSLPGCFTFLGDVVYNGALTIGTSINATGISISYPVPGDGFHPFKTQSINVFWNCTDCTGWAISPINVIGLGPGGFVETISWPHLTTKWGVGMVSLVCAFPPIPVEETTWGNVKSLYR